MPGAARPGNSELSADLGGVSARLPRQPSWLLRLGLAAGLMLGLTAAALGGTALLMNAVRSGLAPSTEIALCDWSRLPEPEPCAQQPVMRQLDFERTLLRHRTFHLNELEPRIDTAWRGTYLHVRGRQAREVSEAWPWQERDALESVLLQAGKFQRSDVPFEPGRLTEPGYLGSLSIPPTYIDDDGVVQTLGPSHPLALEADRRALAAMEAVRPTVGALAEAVHQDVAQQMGRGRRGSLLDAVGLWLAALIAGGLLAIGAMIALVWLARRRDHLEVQLRPSGLRVGGRGYRWEEIDAAVFTGGRPMVRHVDGRVDHGPRLSRTRDAEALDEQAQAFIQARREQPELVEQAQRALAGLRERRSEGG